MYLIYKYYNINKYTLRSEPNWDRWALRAYWNSGTLYVVCTVNTLSIILFCFYQCPNCIGVRKQDHGPPTQNQSKHEKMPH